MIKLSRCVRCVVCAVGILLSTVFAAPTWASIIEFREAGTSAVIGTLNVASPPATPNTGWSTTDPSDLLALYLEDSLFHLGTGNLLSTATPTGVFLLSFDGSSLDAGGFAITLLIDPSNPVAVEHFLSFVFTGSDGGDFIGLGTTTTFPDGSQTEGPGVASLADASVPEPGTASLVLIGLAAAGRIARRKRR